jgi:hypothetical protein
MEQIQKSFFQTMYCNESCRNSDRVAHKVNECGLLSPEYITSIMEDTFGGSNAFPPCVVHLLITLRLVNVIGLDVIRKAVLEKKPRESLFGGDLRTRGFQEGKFQTVTLEALLSLEDSFDENWSKNDQEGLCRVSKTFCISFC